MFLKNKKIKYILIAFLIIGFFYFFFELKYSQKIYPNIYIGEVKIGGLSKEEAKLIINERINNVNQEGIKFLYKEKEIIVYPIESSFDAELVNNLINFKVNETINEALLIGRNGKLLEKFNLLFNKKNISIKIDLREEEITNNLRDVFSFYYPQDSYFYLESNVLKIEKEKAGDIIDYKKGIQKLKDNLGNLNFSNISLAGQYTNANITEENCLSIRNNLQQILDLTPITLEYEMKKIKINKDDLLDIINLLKKDNEIIIEIDREKTEQYIKENISVQIDQTPRLPKFNLNNGLVENFQPGMEGRKLDLEKTTERLITLIEEPFKNFYLPVEKIILESSYSNELEIKEIIGKYILGFASSTTDRISNISNGSKAINGLLLKPGEEFSLIKTLGKIDESNGYVKEAIIKNNSIYYEFGGGLCHLSTTLFRAVLNSGLPVTMRQNHSYHMSYYEPAGMDATIYDPLPDFKFVNDTEKYILIQAEVREEGLSIELWGTNDGRIINMSEPTIYNIVKPNPTRMIKTTTLPSQKIQCTQSAYNGLDAYFDYEVIYPDGETKKRRFESHYVPRQGTCLIGI